ncbi:Sulfotransferase [Trinorchestia longiramus]|nr:Sulfotransferase [Trinorchestia longiramus]
MSISRIFRTVSKLLPSLVQIIIIVAILHLVTKGMMIRARKHLQGGFYPSQGEELGLSQSVIQKRHLVHLNLAKHQQRASSFKKMKKIFSKPKSSQRKQIMKKNTPRSLPKFEEWQNRIQQRIRQLHLTCSRLGLGLWKNESSPSASSNDFQSTHLPLLPAYQSLLVSRDRNLTFCPVSNSGSNWISKQLLALTGEFTPHQLAGRLSDPPSVLARHKFPFLPSWELYPIVLNKSTNILVVRHPFDRFLHYFRRSLENSKKNPNEFSKFGRKIVNKYRKISIKRKEPTFDEFAQFLIDLNPKSSEEHWRSVARKCTPCHIPFNIIGHYDTLWEDITYAWKMADLKRDLVKYPDDEVTPDIRQRYFSQVSKDNLLKLHAKYKLDFELFGYQIDDLLAYSYDDPKSDPTTQSPNSELQKDLSG